MPLYRSKTSTRQSITSTKLPGTVLRPDLAADLGPTESGPRPLLVSAGVRFAALFSPGQAYDNAPMRPVSLIARE